MTFDFVVTIISLTEIPSPDLKKKNRWTTTFDEDRVDQLIDLIRLDINNNGCGVSSVKDE